MGATSHLTAIDARGTTADENLTKCDDYLRLCRRDRDHALIVCHGAIWGVARAVGPSVGSASVFSGSASESYRLDGLLAKRVNPNGETISLAYDAARRPTSATLANASTISQTYDRVGKATP